MAGIRPRRDPEWWAEARALRATGMTYRAISGHLGQSFTAIWKACNPERSRAHGRKHYREVVKQSEEKSRRAAEAERRWRQRPESIEKRRQYKREWYEKNREQVCAYVRRYYRERRRRGRAKGVGA